MMRQLVRADGTLSEATQTFLLQAEAGGDGCVSGTLRWVNHEKALHFVGIDCALLAIDAWLDEENPRPADMNLRTFRAGRHMRPAVCGANLQGLTGVARRRGDARRKEAFLVRIIFRQHNSWQGEVCWKAQRLYFRSTLELMCLIHSALDPGAARCPSVAEPVAETALQAM